MFRYMGFPVRILRQLMWRHFQTGIGSRWLLYVRLCTRLPRNGNYLAIFFSGHCFSFPEEEAVEFLLFPLLFLHSWQEEVLRHLRSFFSLTSFWPEVLHRLHILPNPFPVQKGISLWQICCILSLFPPLLYLLCLVLQEWCFVVAPAQQLLSAVLLVLPAALLSVFFLVLLLLSQRLPFSSTHILFPVFYYPPQTGCSPGCHRRRSFLFS